MDNSVRNQKIFAGASRVGQAHPRPRLTALEQGDRSLHVRGPWAPREGTDQLVVRANDEWTPVSSVEGLKAALASEEPSEVGVWNDKRSGFAWRHGKDGIPQDREVQTLESRTPCLHQDVFGVRGPWFHTAQHKTRALPSVVEGGPEPLLKESAVVTRTAIYHEGGISRPTLLTEFLEDGR